MLNSSGPKTSAMKHTTLPITLALTLFCAVLKAQIATAPIQDANTATAYNFLKIQKWFSMAKNDVELFEADTSRARFGINQNGIDLNSTLAAFIFHYGGMKVDHGWLRVLGSGCKEFERGLAEWNRGKNEMKKDSSRYLLVADDVIGGFWALNLTPDTKLDAAIVHYRGPHDLRWTPTGMRYSDFLRFCFFGQISEYYRDFRWKTWESEIPAINEWQVISCYPLLWTREGKEIKANRKVVPIERLWELYQSSAAMK
ncbi:MAG: hypothetical protein RL021_522 [Bacteroidota bacterium]